MEAKGKPAKPKLSRRKFLNYCGMGILFTASYQIISVFAEDFRDPTIQQARCCGPQVTCTKPCAVVRGNKPGDIERA